MGSPKRNPVPCVPSRYTQRVHVRLSVDVWQPPANIVIATRKGTRIVRASGYVRDGELSNGLRVYVRDRDELKAVVERIRKAIGPDLAPDLR